MVIDNGDICFKDLVMLLVFSVFSERNISSWVYDRCVKQMVRACSLRIGLYSKLEHL